MKRPKTAIDAAMELSPARPKLVPVDTVGSLVTLSLSSAVPTTSRLVTSTHVCVYLWMYHTGEAAAPSVRSDAPHQVGAATGGRKERVNERMMTQSSHKPIRQTPIHFAALIVQSWRGIL